MTFTRQSQSLHKEKTILLFLEYLTTYTRQWIHSSAKLQPHDTKSHTLTLKQKEMGRLKPLWHFTAVVWKTGCIGTFILLSLLYCGHFGVEFRYFWRVQHCPMVIKCICDRRRRRKKYIKYSSSISLSLSSLPTHSSEFHPSLPCVQRCWVKTHCIYRGKVESWNKLEIKPRGRYFASLCANQKLVSHCLSGMKSHI